MAFVAALIGCQWMLSACQPAQARSGLASYDRHTSSMVTAARYEPRGSSLRVTNPRSGRSVVVTVNDSGPFNGGRVLDLSTGAFAQLFGGLGRGVGFINYEVVGGRGSYLSARGGSARQRAAGRHWRHHYSDRHWRHRRH